MADDNELAPDELAPDPNEPPGRLLVGILGESANDGKVLLYLDLALQKRYEIPKDAILRRQKLPAAQSPLGVDASMIWVRPDTILTRQLNQQRHIAEEFLAGDFTAPRSFTPTEALALPQITPNSAVCYPSEGSNRVTRIRLCSLWQTERET